MNCVIPGQFVPALIMMTIGVAIASPPTVGRKAPDFTLATLGGKNVRLSDVLSEKPVVLVVLRGYPGYQCPLCNRQVQDFLQNGAALQASAARVIMVYPGPAAGLSARAEEFLANKDFPDNFDLVLDPDYRFTTKYDLRWKAPKETAYPSTFVIDPRGIIIFSKISGSHGERTKASEILEVLRKARNATQ